MGSAYSYPFAAYFAICIVCPILTPWNCTFIPLPLFAMSMWSNSAPMRFSVDAVDAVISHTDFIQMVVCARRSSSLSSSSLTIYRRLWCVRCVRCFIPGSRFVNLCTASIAFISLNREGFHTTEQYSTVGLTYTLKALINDDTFLEWKHRMMRFADLIWALRQILEMCVQNVRRLSTVTPKSETPKLRLLSRPPRGCFPLNCLTSIVRDTQA